MVLYHLENFIAGLKGRPFHSWGYLFSKKKKGRVLRAAISRECKETRSEKSVATTLCFSERELGQNFTTHTGSSVAASLRLSKHELGEDLTTHALAASRTLSMRVGPFHKLHQHARNHPQIQYNVQTREKALVSQLEVQDEVQTGHPVSRHLSTKEFSFAKLPFLLFSNSLVRGHLSLKDTLALQLGVVLYREVLLYIYYII
ncbi:hypothetical protein LAZ67_23000457 [Cordylochernes scorpioides]|uniref:Uncharacterized protein n=1 Tax=Cordylochernes scorpioides TaxID=51811 RepID=A0ABY6LQ11_9ARAC|nr:hypothetical protein LAZ67_23000457 [Cordylochernes scorpioides]